MRTHAPDDIRDFFARSDCLDYLVLRPLSHIATNWETYWDDETWRYKPEPLSFADDLNQVIELMATSPRPAKYHINEDVVVERVLHELKWPVQKKGGRWVGADYPSMLERGGFRDLDQKNLIAAATGRVHAALDFGQAHIDVMEAGHRHMLTALLTIIIYHRYCYGTSLLREEKADDETAGASGLHPT